MHKLLIRMIMYHVVLDACNMWVTHCPWCWWVQNQVILWELLLLYQLLSESRETSSLPYIIQHQEVHTWCFCTIEKYILVVFLQTVQSRWLVLLMDLPLVFGYNKRHPCKETATAMSMGIVSVYIYSSAIFLSSIVFKTGQRAPKNLKND